MSAEFKIYEFRTKVFVGSVATEEAANKDCIARYLASSKKITFFWEGPQS